VKKVLFALAIISVVSTSFAITKQEAEKKIVNYVGLGKDYTINVCENDKYFIGEINLKGYENLSTVRKVFVNKQTGDIIPEMARASDFCYMLNK
jgi:predicted nucleic acid-binding Zn finger protein